MIKLFDEFINEAENYLSESADYTPEDIYNMAVQLKDNGSVKDVKQIKSGWGPKGFCFEMYYSKGLICKFDFVNKYEYIYEYRTNDENTIGNSSTDEIDRTDWEVTLNAVRHINSLISNLTAGVKRASGNEKRYYNAYNRSNKSSDYEKYLKEKRWVEIWNKRIARYRELLAFA
ncbi:hypothetical protein [uncultured Methanobrevibacter sp.]|uniref:hypothetical protein n=1 Tax=uncultured Methanobrevibacter sp. TaxID=253161 RepID=UPI0025E6E3C8|nr:hypothetical protein [uncultured Methanobrevibacter sp.]